MLYSNKIKQIKFDILFHSNIIIMQLLFLLLLFSGEDISVCVCLAILTSLFNVGGMCVHTM